MRLPKISPKVKYFLLGILFVFIAIVVGIWIWNPAGKVEKDREWFNQRSVGASNIVNSHLVKINQIAVEIDRDFNELVNESNKPNSDKKKLNQYATVVRQNITKSRTLAEETCSQFKAFIQSDERDFKQRGEEIDKLCGIFEHYNKGLDMKETAVKALLDGSRLVYDVNVQMSNEWLTDATKKLGEFESSPLQPSY